VKPRLAHAVVLVPTFARVRLLQEQLACLLDQDWPCQIIILNDCPRQRLHFRGLLSDRVSVRVVNHPTTFATLGEKRNHLLTLAGDRLAIWADDDDWCFPWYVRSMVFAASKTGWGISEKSWFFDSKAWRAANWTLACIGPADQWLAKGGADAVDCGEDLPLRKIVTDQNHGTYRGHGGYIYRWGQGNFHVSGKGDPKGGEAHHREASRRLDSGEEPSGEIYLEPTEPDMGDAPGSLMHHLDSTKPMYVG
jgi:hypothetical protein